MNYFYETCRKYIPAKLEGYVTDYDQLRDELKRQLRDVELELHRSKERGETIAEMVEIIEKAILR